MKNILIIGKKSFLGTSLYKFLKNFYSVKILSFEKVIAKHQKYFDSFSHIINTSIHKKYVDSKYKLNFDLDRQFIKKFNRSKFIYIFFNTRKIYKLKNNILETSKLEPKSFYAKNKLKTEIYLKKNLNDRLLSLRISNVIGQRYIKSKRRVHKIFYDNFLDYLRDNKKITVNDEYKDFISIDQFNRIIKRLIQLNITGIYNVSLSKKVFISEISSWLDKEFSKKINYIKGGKDSFTLSNKKLIKKIKVKISKNQLKKFCNKII